MDVNSSNHILGPNCGKIHNIANSDSQDTQTCISNVILSQSDTENQITLPQNYNEKYQLKDSFRRGSC